MGGVGKLNNIFIFCSFLVACTSIHGWQDSLLLRPPVGNRLVLKYETENGMLMYKCSSGEWLLVGATAGLVQASDRSVRVGEYNSAFLQDQATTSATWVLENPANDFAESGYTNSSVSGKEIAIAPSGGIISEALLQATAHQFNGVASLISYIQRLFPQGGDPPAKNTCVQESSTLQVPFQAEFWFWTQDLVPPVAPPSISISDERVVEGLFGEGIVTYRYVGSSWQLVEAQAALYNVPGGTPIGNYSLQEASADGGRGKSYFWQTGSSYGFQIVGKDERKPVLVNRNCLAWSLVAVTSFSRKENVLGTYTHVQMVSTKGGLPPSQTGSAPVPGELITSPFSAIFWFYTKS